MPKARRSDSRRLDREGKARFGEALERKAFCERKTAPFIGLNEEPAHRGNANRFAFWADTEEEVNRLGAIIREAGAQHVEGPEYCHEYTPGYYAVFFEDADGNKWEICCRNTKVR